MELNMSANFTRRTAVLGVTFAGGTMAFGGPLRAQVQSHDDATSLFDAILTPDVSVPLRDGVLLATDVYRPARDGKVVDKPFPVLLIRTPYNKSAYGERLPGQAKALGAAEAARLYVSRGYVVVIQDCRGRFKSGGQFVKYVLEGPDGVDTCQWLLRQSWCNGKIGSFGGSYLAHVQSAMAALGAPGLSAMFLDCGGFSNGYGSGVRQGGAFELKQVTWAFNSMGDSPVVAADPLRQKAIREIDLKAWMLSMPWKRGHSPLKLAPDYEKYIFDQWEHGRFDDFWKQPSIYWMGYYQASTAPTIHLSGWYDAYTRTAAENYMGQRRLGRDTRLIMGPWTHTATTVTHSGNVEFGPQASLDGNLAPDYATLRLNFFDRQLKGRTTGPVLPRVQIFVMGGGGGLRNKDGRLQHGGRWRSEVDWPIPDRVSTRYFLGGNGALQTQPAVAPPVSYNFDPADPVPTIGGNLPGHKPWPENMGGFDQRETPEIFGAKAPYLPLEARPDILTFQTEPLDRDIEVTGEIVANLWVSSDCLDTDFTIKLIDVYPPSEDYPQGYALNLTDGIIRARYRESWEKPRLLTPGEVVPVRIEAFPTSNLFCKGHRIRIDVSSSNFPRFDVNPNTGDPEGAGLTRKVARNTIYADAGRPSHVILPVIPQRSAGG
jgi:putative CocE/NonD family hydrolase